MSNDPAVSNSDLYKVVLENERVRVLEYTDRPGDHTTPHNHPDSVMITLSAFDRRLILGDQSREVSLTAHQAMWLPAQMHAGENTGNSDTHTSFVELKEPTSTAGTAGEPALGPQDN